MNIILVLRPGTSLRPSGIGLSTFTGGMTPGVYLPCAISSITCIFFLVENIVLRPNLSCLDSPFEADDIDNNPANSESRSR